MKVGEADVTNPYQKAFYQNMVFVKADKLEYISMLLGTGIDEDWLPCMVFQQDKLINQVDDVLDPSDMVQIDPELAIDIYNQVKAIGVDRLK